jgi:hypothetical protein
MSQADSKPTAFDLSRNGDVVVIAERKQHVVDGIVM